MQDPDPTPESDNLDDFFALIKFVDADGNPIELPFADDEDAGEDGDTEGDV